MTYVCLKEHAWASPKGYELIEIREEDMEAIRQWRNAQMDVLRQKHVLLEEEQKRYFVNEIKQAFSKPYPKQILFSFLFKGECIGYGGLTHIDWEAKRGEVSFLLNPSRKQYAREMTEFLHLLARASFKTLKMHRLFTETFAFRALHIAILENFGFQREGVLREHVYKQDRFVDSLLHGLLAKEWRDSEK